ncbi:MAG: hypothetical protein V5A47_12430 [Bacteroidales bacterium]|nr:hypothetical protein [Bacteroidales bacterium]MBS3775778.1 hypothetical protein [Bacteroidales bacterium]
MLKTAITIMIVVLVFSALYDLFLIASPQTVGGSTLEARSELILDDIDEEGVAETIVIYTRHLGVFGLCITISLFFILFKGFRKGEQWAWWAILIVGLIAWGFGLITQIGEGDTLNIILHLIGIILFLAGIILPIKVFFAKKA